MFSWMRKSRRAPECEGDGVLRASANVRAIAADGGLAVFDTVRGGVFRSNAVGAEIWRELIERQRDPSSVAEELAGQFGISTVRARQDVARFVGQLREEKLVIVQ